MSKPKVLVVGSGGVGTICALSLTVRDRSEVTLVVRSDYDVVTQQGYTIDSCTYGHIDNWRPHHVARTVEEAAQKYGDFDYILVTTKNIPDGPMTCETIIKPAVSAKSVIILVQNGIGIDEAMLEAFPDHLVLSAVSYIGSTNYHGKVENKGPDSIVIGDFKPEGQRRPESQQALETFAHIYQNDNNLNKVAIDNDVKRSRWEKLLYNSVMNPISAVVDLDVTRCQINGANDTLFRPAMRELLAIAKSDGVEIDELSVEKFIHIGDGLFYTPSMGVDARKKQLMELEIILGNPLRKAKQNGVDAPILSTIYLLGKLVQFRIKEAIGQVSIDTDDYKGNSDDLPRIFHEKSAK